MEAKKGIDKILLYRLLSKETTENAWKLAFQTEHEIGLSRDAESTPTKDGPIQTPGTIEYDFSATSIIAKGDEHVEEIKQALINGEMIEIWEIDKSEKGTGEDVDKYKATYFRGYVTSYSSTANSEDSLELSIDFAINGIGQEGYTSLTEDQAEIVQYVFRDTSKVVPEG